MIIYLDSDFMCHVDNAEGRTAIETAEFEGKSKVYIESYRYVPQGQTWTRADGVQFHGLMVCPAKDYNRIMTDVAISYLDDDQAESVTILFPQWEVGKDYSAEDKDKGISASRVQDESLLYKCIQSHRSQTDWPPHLTPALWVRTSTEEWPEWVQPTGAHDAYAKDSKVSHNGKHWISDLPANVYEPGVYGWHEATEEDE